MVFEIPVFAVFPAAMADKLQKPVVIATLFLIGRGMLKKLLGALIVIHHFSAFLVYNHDPILQAIHHGLHQLHRFSLYLGLDLQLGFPFGQLGDHPVERS